jgi:hypothetical protein
MIVAGSKSEEAIVSGDSGGTGAGSALGPLVDARRAESSEAKRLAQLRTACRLQWMNEVESASYTMHGGAADEGMAAMAALTTSDGTSVRP